MVKDIIRDTEKLSARSMEWDVRGNQDKSTELVQALDDTIDVHPELIYLCANELGYTERALDVRFKDDTYIFMNPMIQKADKFVLSREFDRLNGKEYIIPRYSEIELVYQDCLGAVKAAKFVDDGALIICQALDTMDGIFAHDIGLEILPEFDKATPKEQDEIIREYLKSLEELYTQLDSELSQDENTKDTWKAAKFMEAAAKGEVEFADDEQPLSNRKKKLINKLAKKIEQQKNKLKFWRKNKND